MLIIITLRNCEKRHHHERALHSIPNELLRPRLLTTKNGFTLSIVFMTEGN